MWATILLEEARKYFLFCWSLENINEVSDSLNLTFSTLGAKLNHLEFLKDTRGLSVEILTWSGLELRHQCLWKHPGLRTTAFYWLWSSKVMGYIPLHQTWPELRLIDDTTVVYISHMVTLLPSFRVIDYYRNVCVYVFRTSLIQTCNFVWFLSSIPKKDTYL